MQTTWDGLPVAREPPYACCVVVWRERDGRREFLLLHRLAPGGMGYEGDWAWTPPAGARQPGERAASAATRELKEETGLALPLKVANVRPSSEDVAVFVAHAPPESGIVLDAEHDRFVWLPLEEALPKCLPGVVASGLADAAAWIDAHGAAN